MFSCVKGGMRSVISNWECGMVRRNVKHIIKKVANLILSNLNVRRKHVQHPEHLERNNVEHEGSENPDEPHTIADDDPILDCEIDEQGIVELQKSGESIVFIDIREPFEYRQGYIEDALMIPMNEIPNVYANLPKDACKIIYCAAGIRSFDVCVYLRSNGVENVLSMEGGVGTWAKHSYTYPHESRFYVGQIVELEEKYIIQHIWKGQQECTLKLVSYHHIDQSVVFTESVLKQKLQGIFP